MNIKQAEQATGISRQNIRFYEKQGLLSPARNRLNAYREYSEADIRALKLIKALRMVDMPLEDIRAVLAGTLPLPQAAAAQQQRLSGRQAQLEQAMRFCQTLAQTAQPVEQLDVEACLARMESERKGGYFMQWINDYRQVAGAEHDRMFSFEPEEDFHSAREFTDVLLAYAKAKHLDMTITQEGAEPLFTLDGVEYRAQKYYHYFRGIPLPAVRCEMLHPELYAPAGVPKGRQKLLRFLHFAWPSLLAGGIYAAYFFSVGGLMNSWAGWLLLLAVLALVAGQGYYYTTIHYNDGGAPRRRK